ncbi:12062_t:CDS:2, partial [Acaulospora colombiana]
APYKVKPSLLGRLGQKESWMQVVESIMDRVPKEDRTRVGELVLLYRRKLQEDDDTTILTHSREDGEKALVEAIIKKWDFNLWRPFPAGLERKRVEYGNWIVLKVKA